MTVNYSNLTIVAYLIEKNSGSYIWYTTSSLIICSMGIITNLINIVVLLNPSLKEPCFKFMLINSIAGFCHLNFINLYPFVLFCKCPLSRTYSAAIFTLLVKNYIGPSLSMFRIIYEICLTSHVYSILTNTRKFKWISTNYFIFAMFLFSFSYYLPVPVLKTLVAEESASEVIYLVKLNWFGKTVVGRVIAISSDMVRIFMATVFLTSINVATVIKFRQRYGKKNKISHSFIEISSKLVF